MSKKLTEGEQDSQGNTISGVSSVFDMAISPDGRYLYAANLRLFNNDVASITIFSRDLPSGQLRFIEQVVNGDLDFAGQAITELQSPRVVDISGDGRFLYVGEKELLQFAIDTASGRLTYLDKLSDARSNTSVLVSDSDDRIYVSDGSSVTWLNREPTTGATEIANRKVDNVLEEVETIAVSPDGRHLYAVEGSSLSVFERSNDGSLIFVERLDDNGTDATGNFVDGLLSLSDVQISPDGRFVYTAAEGDNAIAVFARDEVSGQLQFRDHIEAGDFDPVAGTSVTGTIGVHQLRLSADGGFLYAIASISDAVSVFVRDANTGALVFVEALANGATDNQGGTEPVTGIDFPFDLTLSLDGKHLYVASYIQNSIALFERDFATGRLKYVQTLTNGSLDSAGNSVSGLDRVRSLDLTGDGRFLYAAESFGEFSIFARDPVSGELTYLQSVINYMPEPNSTVFLGSFLTIDLSWDERQLYIQTPDSDGKLIVFDRDETTGLVTFKEVIADGDLTPQGKIVDGLTSSNILASFNIATSPDGGFVYLSGRTGRCNCYFQERYNDRKLRFRIVTTYGLQTSRKQRQFWQPSGPHRDGKRNGA